MCPDEELRRFVARLNCTDAQCDDETRRQLSLHFKRAQRRSTTKGAARRGGVGGPIRKRAHLLLFVAVRVGDAPVPMGVRVAGDPPHLSDQRRLLLPVPLAHSLLDLLQLRRSQLPDLGADGARACVVRLLHAPPLLRYEELLMLRPSALLRLPGRQALPGAPRRRSQRLCPAPPPPPRAAGRPEGGRARAKRCGPRAPGRFEAVAVGWGASLCREPHLCGALPRSGSVCRLLLESRKNDCS